MGTVEKINFPYCLRTEPSGENIAIFFGTDFYNLPDGSNRQLFIECTNQMLAYMRRHFPESTLLYQPHPNEADEYTKLDLGGFKVGEKIVAEVLLYEKASSVQFVFSACSGSSISAYEMGFNAAVGLELLHGALPEEVIIGYRSYFAGLPESFFMRSLNDSLPACVSISRESEARMASIIKEAIGPAKKLWILTSSPGLAVQAALVLKYARERNPDLRAGLLKIGGRRWETTPVISNLEKGFDETIYLRDRRILYSARPGRLFEAIRTAWKLRRLPIKEGDVIVSFCNTLFEENCIISYHKKNALMITFIENRWHHFTFADKGRSLPQSGFRTPWGSHAFAWFLEPLLGLYRTVNKEYKDGKVINLFRYRAPLEIVYDTAFILMPDAHNIAPTTTEPYTLPFTVRLMKRVRNMFGLRPVLGRLRRMPHRIRVLQLAKADGGGTWEGIARFLQNRSHLVAILDAPVLLHDAEIVLLAKYAAGAEGTVVEIGAAYGGSALAMLVSLRGNTQLYSIDPFVQDSMAEFQATESGCKHSVIRAVTQLGWPERAKRWTLIPSYSFDVVRGWKRPVDVLFVDGDHTYPAVRRDAEEWLPFLKENGFILFHDSCRTKGTSEGTYDKGWPGPTRLVEELMSDPRVEFVEAAESLSVFRKLSTHT